MTPLPAGITGLSALNPALSTLIQTNPGVSAILVSTINEEEVNCGGRGGWVNGGQKYKKLTQHPALPCVPF